MPQVFHPSMNTIARVSIFGAVFFLSALVAITWIVVRSPYITRTGVVRDQPVPFSHKHHVGDIGIDCRYCHTSVEKSAFAGIPPTETCMNCHSQLFATSAILEPVRRSFATGTPLAWTRVHDLPDFAYFDHSIHIHKGVACVTCHGPVAEMPLMWREHSLYMQWCLACHRDPGPNLSPQDLVFATTSVPRTDDALMEDLLTKNEIETRTDCTTCHR